MTKPLPVMIKIGAYYVSISTEKNLIRDEGACGRYMPCDKKIQIDADMCPDMQWGTLYHELIEAMAEIYCIKALEEDHDAINIMGEVLHQMMRDNPREMMPNDQ